MSERLPNLSYYDSTGQSYGFTKPFSEERAKVIDEEVSRIIAEQYERAKNILRQYAEGHAKLTDVLITREVIFTRDVEEIFGPRPWKSRTDEILAADPRSKGQLPGGEGSPDGQNTADGGNGDNQAPAEGQSTANEQTAAEGQTAANGQTAALANNDNSGNTANNDGPATPTPPPFNPNPEN